MRKEEQPASGNILAGENAGSAAGLEPPTITVQVDRHGAVLRGDPGAAAYGRHVIAKLDDQVRSIEPEEMLEYSCRGGTLIRFVDGDGSPIRDEQRGRILRLAASGPDAFRRTYRLVQLYDSQEVEVPIPKI